MRKHKEIEEIFRDGIVANIKESFLHNPNIQYNSEYFVRMSKYDLLDYIQRLANNMLEDINKTEHLILDNGVKELQEQLKEANNIIWQLTDGSESSDCDNMHKCHYCNEKSWGEIEHNKDCIVLKAETFYNK